jgi:hypothetical protein
VKVKGTITVLRPQPELRQLWQASKHRPEYLDGSVAVVTFVDAPGDRGTEIHVDLEHSMVGGKIGEVVQKVLGNDPRAALMDDLRKFKQIVETGVIARSEGSPMGEERGERAQRPAQPLDQSERVKVGI